MKTTISAMIAATVLGSVLALPAQANPQHERMRRCNAEAKEQVLKGEERKQFMSACLRGKHERAATTAAVLPAELEAAERMKACNLAASERELSGEARRSYVTACSQG